MSAFLLSVNVAEELDKIFRCFWWVHEMGTRKVHWTSWEKICHPKSEGGMGIRDFGNFNLALLAKMAC